VEVQKRSITKDLMVKECEICVRVLAKLGVLHLKKSKALAEKLVVVVVVGNYMEEIGGRRDVVTRRGVTVHERKRHTSRRGREM